MLFKKKNRIDEEDLKLLERLESIKEYVRQLGSDLNFGYITQQEYEVRIAPILHELEEMENAREDIEDSRLGFMEWLEAVFDSKEYYDEAVHKEIGKVMIECHHIKGDE